VKALDYATAAPCRLVPFFLWHTITTSRCPATFSCLLVFICCSGIISSCLFSDGTAVDKSSLCLRGFGIFTVDDTLRLRGLGTGTVASSVSFCSSAVAASTSDSVSSPRVVTLNCSAAWSIPFRLQASSFESSSSPDDLESLAFDRAFSTSADSTRSSYKATHWQTSPPSIFICIHRHMITKHSRLICCEELLHATSRS